MNAVNPENPGLQQIQELKYIDVGGGIARRTHIDLDALGNVSIRLESLKSELEGLIKQWDESTERYQSAAGSDDMNGNLKQQSTQAKQDADQHSKATDERAQKTADTSKEAHTKYSGTEDDNHAELKKPAEHLSGGGSDGGAPSGGHGHSGPAQPAVQRTNLPPPEKDITNMFKV